MGTTKTQGVEGQPRTEESDVTQSAILFVTHKPKSILKAIGAFSWCVLTVWNLAEGSYLHAMKDATISMIMLVWYLEQTAKVTVRITM